MSPTANIDELVDFLVKSLVEHPDEVNIEKRSTGDGTLYEISLHSDDVGKVIGRQGRVIKAIRTLVRAAASVDGGDASVEVIG
ncbi:MAG: KH domain-containing protein [Coriobacteriia bacterium]